jgi:hypothetical protein
MRMDEQTARHYYITSGLHYHVAARYSAFAGLVQVCGILFHHAIEMYLKGCLRQRLNEGKLRQLGHNLSECWKRFKDEMSDARLDTFDATIAALDQHEDLRYPEWIAPAGVMTLIINFSKPRNLPSAQFNRGRQFDLIVDDVDALAKVILEKSKLNSAVLTAAFNPNAREFLERDNKSMIW